MAAGQLEGAPEQKRVGEAASLAQANVQHPAWKAAVAENFLEPPVVSAPHNRLVTTSHPAQVQVPPTM